MGRIVSLSNHKGGVGKTTSTVNIGSALSHLGKNTLLIDLDPQASMTQSFGISEPDFDIYSIMKGDIEMRIQNIQKNLDLIPSTLDLSGAEMEFGNEAGREFILKETLEAIQDKYDYILLDCPPSLGLITINALTASDEIIIPLQSHFLALKGLTKINEMIAKVKRRLNPKLEIGGVFVTQYDGRKILHRDVAETINEFFGDKVFKTMIRDNIALAEAPSRGQDIFSYDPKCYGSQDYLELAKELLKRYSKK